MKAFAMLPEARSRFLVQMRDETYDLFTLNPRTLCISDPNAIYDGQPYYVPAFWELVTSGMSDQHFWLDGAAHGESDAILLTDVDRETYPELRDYYAIILWETHSGAIQHNLLTRAPYEELFK